MYNVMNTFGCGRQAFSKTRDLLALDDLCEQAGVTWPIDIDRLSSIGEGFVIPYNLLYTVGVYPIHEVMI